MTGKLLAIDGLALLRRVYESNRDTDSPEKAEWALHQSVATIRKLLSSHAPTHVLVAIEHEGGSWRHELYPPFHQHRSPMPAGLHERLPGFIQELEATGLHTVRVPHVSASDVIATAVLRWLSDERGEAVIAATSKELLVLIDAGAIIWNYVNGERRDAAWLSARYGITPKQVPDFIGLTGNPKEGIPGVAKVGEKTAAKLLQSHGNLEGVMAGPGILMDTIGKRLRAERDNAFLSRTLATVKSDVTLGVTWRMLEYPRK